MKVEFAVEADRGVAGAGTDRRVGIVEIADYH